MYDDTCACSELCDRCFTKAEQVRNLHSVVTMPINHSCYESMFIFPIILEGVCLTFLHKILQNAFHKN